MAVKTAKQSIEQNSWKEKGKNRIMEVQSGNRHYVKNLRTNDVLEEAGSYIVHFMP